MTWILKFLASYWREALIALLFAALTLSISLTRKLTIEYRDNETLFKILLAKQEQSFATQVAQAKEKENEVTRTYAATVETLQARHVESLKAAQANAWKNYVARYGLGAPVLGAAVGVHGQSNASGVRGALPAVGVGSGETDRPGALDANRSNFVADCAATTLIAEEWQEWARLNQLPVQ
jgi:hypothetical protein